jgi:hydroxymethylpyrimidine kinase/phosphomethylpyrimidine kinase
MVATSGARLLPQDAIHGLRTKLLPLATVLTPNIPEAKILLEHAGVTCQQPRGIDDMIQLAKQLWQLGPKSVLLKGGHLLLSKDYHAAKPSHDAHIVVDVLYDGVSVTLMETDFLVSKNTHGTGCSLASAVAANLALGNNLERAIRGAVRFVEAGIKTSVNMGRGNGPINHFHSLYSLPFAPYRPLFPGPFSSRCMIMAKRVSVAVSWNTSSIVPMSLRYGRLSLSMNLWLA